MARQLQGNDFTVGYSERGVTAWGGLALMKQMLDRLHIISCHSEFKKIMLRMPIRIDSPYFFVNPHGKLDGKHYALATMEEIWNTACKKR